MDKNDTAGKIGKTGKTGKDRLFGNADILTADAGQASAVGANAAGCNTRLCDGATFIVASAMAAEILIQGLNDNDINLLATFLSTVAANMFAILACSGVQGTDA